jgi:DNA polymerase III subunit epsilon
MRFLERFRSSRGSSTGEPATAASRPAPAASPDGAQDLASPRRTAAPELVAAVPFRQLTFCVLDVETTGFDPAHDRIVELALLRVDHTGRVLQELHTLVDPGQAVDATWVHGIDDADVRGAPAFGWLAPGVLTMLHGAVLVAHNAPFDLSFLRAELARAGIAVGDLPYACTMSLRRPVGLPGPRAHGLAWACWQEGIAIELAHAAVCDARATAAVLARYLAYAAAGGMLCLGDLPARGGASASWTLPTASWDGVAQTSGPVRPRAGVSAVAGSVVPTVRASDHAVHAYALQLAAAAEDFQIDEDEILELSELVAELGLSPDQVRGCHRHHVEALLVDRLDDGLLTWAEQQEVRAFARLLGVGDREVAELLARADQVADVEAKPSPIHGEAAGAGLSVCFTGEFVAIPLTREEVWDLATDAGMVVSKGVTKKLDLLVCLDPGTGTGKLRKAAEYNTVVIDQPTFLGLAGVEPAPEGVLRAVLDRLATRRAANADAAQAQREASAAAARARNRERAQQRRASPTAHQVLWCASGEHEWTRPPQRGRPPRACPEHQAVPA